jgi:hypothetical protein
MNVTRLWFFLAIAGQISVVYAACPVTIQDVKRDTGIGDRNTYCFSLDAANVSGKPISAVNLRAVAMDSKTWEHPLRYSYVVDGIGPGESKRAYFSTHRLLGTDYRGVKVWVDSVQFQDKSEWKDSGDRACAGQDLRKR